MIRHLCWCVVVGCCVRTFGTRCLVFGDTLFLIMDSQVCVWCVVCVCVRNTVHGVATGPPRPFSIVQYFFPPRSRWFTFFIIFLIFALRLHPFPPFSVPPYIRMYVRALLGPVGACVRLCLRVLLSADVPSATRVRHSNFSSVNEIR